MADYTILPLAKAPEIFGDSYPGEFRPLKDALAAEQVAVTYRRMPKGTGSKGSHGHRHRKQEEIFFVISGTLQFKLNEDIHEVGPGTAVRVAPSVVRGVWNDQPEDAELLIISNRIDHDDWEKVEDFWPE